MDRNLKFKSTWRVEAKDKARWRKVIFADLDSRTQCGYEVIRLKRKYIYNLHAKINKTVLVADKKNYINLVLVLFYKL